MPTRIAYIVHTFDMGGLERCIACLANRLDRERFAPLIICLNRSGDAANWLTVDDVPIIELGKRPGNDWSVVPRLSRILKQQQVDVVHSHNWGTLLETVLARKRAGTPVHVHAEHGQQVAANEMGRCKLAMHRMVRRWAFRRLDGLVACAQSVRSRIADVWSYPASRIEFIPNGVERPEVSSHAEESRRAIRRELGLNEGTFLLGSVGRLAPVKDFANAIRAMAHLRSVDVNAHLVLVGDGPERENLWAIAESEGVRTRVHFTGWRENVGDWLQGFDIYVNSSASEAMSLSILEAMAAGLPVVATDVGDTRFLLECEYAAGIVVEPGQATPLSSAILALIVDRSRRDEMGQYGVERFQADFTVDRMVTRYSELYTAALSSKDPSPRLAIGDSPATAHGSQTVRAANAGV